MVLLKQTALARLARAVSQAARSAACVSAYCAWAGARCRMRLRRRGNIPVAWERGGVRVGLGGWLGVVGGLVVGGWASEGWVSVGWVSEGWASGGAGRGSGSAAPRYAALASTSLEVLWGGHCVSARAGVRLRPHLWTPNRPWSAPQPVSSCRGAAHGHACDV
jgi:hypothetical protein